MIWKTKVLEMAVDLGKDELKRLVDALDKIDIDADEDWKRVSLAVIGDLINTHGAEGLGIAKDLLLGLTTGDRKVPNLSGLSLITASGVVAKLQQAEAAERAASKKYIVLVTDILGDILKGLLQSVI